MVSKCLLWLNIYNGVYARIYSGLHRPKLDFLFYFMNMVGEMLQHSGSDLLWHILLLTGG